MNILWFSWKDINHPLAGGAEVVSDQIRIRLVRDGHNVTLITALYPGSQPIEVLNGVKILRSGSKYSVYIKASAMNRSITQEQDFIIDEMNTIPFMSYRYSKEATPILLTYQLARSVWFYQMLFPLSLIGYCLEPAYLRLLAKHYTHTLTESESTKKDLQKYGFDRTDITVFRVGISTKRPLNSPIQTQKNTVLFLGALRPMKRPIDAIKAFELARDSAPELKLIIAGNNSGRYAQKVITYIKNSRHSEAIDMRGRVDERQKLSLLREAQLILVTSIKEGWGLIVTEANSQGTPAIVYNTDGLRDSVVNNKTGIVVKSGDENAMGRAIVKILSNEVTYKSLRDKAFEHSKQFTFENSYRDFLRALIP